MKLDDSVVEAHCANLLQGDVIELPMLTLPGVNEHGTTRIETPSGVVVVSQTCDVVQTSKEYCTLAPILHEPSEEIVKNARKGRSPLHVYLSGDEGRGFVADLERAVAVPKKLIEGLNVSFRGGGEPSSLRARELSARIARVFGRFPFPDEVVPAFRKFRDKVQSKSGKTGNLGRVLDLIDDIRVAADQWPNPGRNLTLYFIVEKRFLAHIDDLDRLWSWNTNDVIGARRGEESQSLSLDRVCELILGNLESKPEVLAELWSRFQDAVEQNLLNVHDDEEVFLFESVVISEEEMSLRLYKTTESFDLDVLSHSTD